MPSWAHGSSIFLNYVCRQSLLTSLNSGQGIGSLFHLIDKLVVEIEINLAPSSVLFDSRNHPIKGNEIDNEIKGKWNLSDTP